MAFVCRGRPCPTLLTEARDWLPEAAREFARWRINDDLRERLLLAPESVFFALGPREACEPARDGALRSSEFCDLSELERANWCVCECSLLFLRAARRAAARKSPRVFYLHLGVTSVFTQLLKHAFACLEVVVIATMPVLR